MTAVTVGVPVYNGGAMLREGLDALKRQTFNDFNVLIYDNASTDDTGQIAREFCDHDSRFHYFRQQENRGPTQNFIDVMEAASTPYFLWRAHDDLSDETYLARCHESLERSPHAALAATRVLRERVNADGSVRLREIPFRLPGRDRSLPTLARNLKIMHQCWFYGMWRKEPLRDIFHSVNDVYPHAWGADFLMLFAALVRYGIVGSDATTFHQRIIHKASQDASQAAPRTAAQLASMRAQFAAFCRHEAGAHYPGRLQRAGIRLVVDRFTSRRIGSRSRLARLSFQSGR